MVGNNKSDVPNSQIFPNNGINLCVIWKHFDDFILKNFEFNKSESSFSLDTNECERREIDLLD